MKHILLLVLFLLSLNTFSQQKISLEECYDLINKNYPLAKQSTLLATQYELEIDVVKKTKLPKLDLLVQASYQSDVTKTPFMTPESGIEAPNLDQYKANLSVNQLIFSGNKVDASADLKDAELLTKQKQLEVNLYQLKKQVNQLYFSILNLQERKLLLNAKRKELNTKIKEVRAGIEFGILLPTSDSFIEVALLKLEQQQIEVELNKLSSLQTMSELIGVALSSNAILTTTNISTNFFSDIQRPEIELFELKKMQLETSDQLISKNNIPQISGFATGGVGNPGLNMLENAFKAYYWVGVRLNWTVFDWNSTKKERSAIKIDQEIIDSEAEIFNLNTKIELFYQNSEIKKIMAFIDSDLAIIELQKKILKTTESQLKNGVINTSDYVTELTNLYEAENNLNTHKIQLLLAKANYNITQGN